MKRYGPHDVDTAPNVVVVKEAGRWFGHVAPRETVHALPAALVRQRQQLNERAHQAWQQFTNDRAAGL